ncbi:hypothetical protein XENORESO_006793 [Xenotaenia resolanae]|uniref:Uncharacterized protein n=1 Tax=Xenotaenia resolanae TaxID=208358 RepID=A0ABV0W1N4_9TELE
MHTHPAKLSINCMQSEGRWLVEAEDSLIVPFLSACCIDSKYIYIGKSFFLLFSSPSQIFILSMTGANPCWLHLNSASSFTLICCKKKDVAAVVFTGCEKKKS